MTQGMPPQDDENGTELFLSVTQELNSAGEVMIKLAFFSENFALAVRMPPRHACEAIDGMRKRTHEIAREIELAQKQQGKTQLEVVRSVPDALRNPQSR